VTSEPFLTTARWNQILFSGAKVEPELMEMDRLIVAVLVVDKLKLTTTIGLERA
jgi:hypothetical protein